MLELNISAGSSFFGIFIQIHFLEFNSFDKILRFLSNHLNLFRNRKSRRNLNRTHRDSSCNKKVMVIHIMIHLYVDKLVESVQNSILVLAQSLHILRYVQVGVQAGVHFEVHLG